jgi:hypothetical protein
VCGTGVKKEGEVICDAQKPYCTFDFTKQMHVQDHGVCSNKLAFCLEVNGDLSNDLGPGEKCMCGSVGPTKGKVGPHICDSNKPYCMQSHHAHVSAGHFKIKYPNHGHCSFESRVCQKLREPWDAMHHKGSKQCDWCCPERKKFNEPKEENKFD